MSVSPSNLTAILLCGGKGERLRPFTDKCPKPLVPVLDKPLLQHLVEFLKGQQIKRFIFCIGYKAEMIREFVDDSLDCEDIDIELSDLGDASIAERLIEVSKDLKGPALVCYGDTIANVRLQDLCSFHNEQQTDVSVTVFPFKSSFGIVDVSGQLATGFREKPDLPYFINIGFFVASPDSLKTIINYSDVTEWMDSLAKKKKLGAFLHEGKHLTVNTEKERQSAESEIIELYTLQ